GASPIGALRSTEWPSYLSLSIRWTRSTAARKCKDLLIRRASLSALVSSLPFAPSNCQHPSISVRTDSLGPPEWGQAVGARGLAVLISSNRRTRYTRPWECAFVSGSRHR